MRKQTINEQLNIPLIKPGESSYMPQLYGDELNDERAYNYPIITGGVYTTSNFSGVDGKNGWANCSGCSSFEGNNGWSNAGGQNDCKKTCEAIFGRGEERTLREACKSTCGSKCTLTKCNGYVPTRSSICSARGLGENCLPIEVGFPLGDGLRDVGGNYIPTTSPTSDLPIASGIIDPTTESSTGTRPPVASPSKGMSTGVIVGISVTSAAVIGLGIWYFKFRKKSA